MQDKWFAFLHKLQAYVNTQCNLIPVVPSALKDEDSLKEVWAGNQELKATTRQQAAQELQAPPQPIPDLIISVLTELVAKLRADLDKLHAAQTAAVPSPSLEARDGGCCPGLEGYPKFYCNIALDNHVQEI
ncbi:hypothetical protein DSO57_1004646 [Entomophthora muscae]|uniref:Uncharacterized protein n=1 Tax=Entomophthora muscae TaxID=34485 RepID=A0ACC2SKV3_9FUNG|nr:hypothetical protein DSO57_1004646 [Entomophthora muscae]